MSPSPSVNDRCMAIKLSLFTPLFTTRVQSRCKKGTSLYLFLSRRQAPRQIRKVHSRMRDRDLENEVLTITDDKFNDLASKIFSFQRQNCPPFAQWLSLSAQPTEI